MNLETPEAMEKFINYWNDMRNYALQTGDISVLNSLIDENFTQEKEYYLVLEDIYKTGGWVIGGTRTIHLNKDLLVSEGEGTYTIASNFDMENTVLWYGGEARAYDNSDNVHRGIALTVQFNQGEWTVLSAHEVN
ncbi:hypothetical protein A7979_11595 [Rothia nasimurium]|uniref:DUF6318 domain-containing protein n=2 Tax=Rothia nasimurium TaxID=85336 RepID=A0A1Y1RQI3_9MICC|nr:hypothetical protein A7979_11595 [Rothia nasimurium]